MTVTAETRRPRSKTLLWLSIFAGLLLLFAANWHLVYVAVTSQPECVPHLRQGEKAVSGQFQAAKSSCRPQ